MLEKVIKTDVRFLSLLAALGLYAGFSSPTPDTPGMIELLIAGLLGFASISAAWRVIRGGFDVRNLWQAAGFLLLFYGFSVVLAVGIVRNDLHYIVRDVLPFLFLFLPVLVGDLFIDQPQRGRILLGAVLAMGTLSALRALFSGVDALLFSSDGVAELYYLANAPTILLASALGFSGFLFGVSGPFTVRRSGFALLCLMVFLLGLLVMGMTLQRASIGFLGVYCIVMTGLIAWRRPMILLLILPMAALVVTPFLGDVVVLLEALVSKTTQHGLNNRAQEWAAVWDEASSEGALRLVFGGGWGSTFLSPAVAGERVNFTHGMMGAMVLKAGLVGFVLACLYIGGILQMLMVVCRTHFMIGFAVLGPLLIDVLLYGAYKSLDFGVLLLVIPVALLSRFSDLSSRRNI